MRITLEKELEMNLLYLNESLVRFGLFLTNLTPPTSFSRFETQSLFERQYFMEKVAAKTVGN